MKFPVSKKDYCKIEQKSNICNNAFCYENELTYPDFVSNEKFENFIDLLMITEENKSHNVHIKDFNRFMQKKLLQALFIMVYRVCRVCIV